MNNIIMNHNLGYALIKPILDIIREGQFRWLGHVVRREPPSMLHEVVNYKVKVTRHEEALEQHG